MNTLSRRKLVLLAFVAVLMAAMTAAAGRTQSAESAPEIGRSAASTYANRWSATSLAGSSHVVDVFHDGIGSLVKVSDKYKNPQSGGRTVTLSSEVKKVQVFADGDQLAADITKDPQEPYTRVGFTVPNHTDLLTIDYERLDGAYSHPEAIYYYGGRVLVWDLLWESFFGAQTLTFHLPEDAAILKVSDDGFTTVVNSHTVRFAVPAGVSIHPWTLYKTPVMPVTYETTETPRFDVHVPLAYERYREFLFSLLENAYALYGGYSGQDINQIHQQDRYGYSITPWPLTCGAGCSAAGGGGPSDTSARYMPQAVLPASEPGNSFVSVTLHELGNGWWLPFRGATGTSTLPWWIDNEGHSGFLRAQASLDLGYCAEAQEQYARHHQEYLACIAQIPYEPPCYGLIATMHNSFQDKYGWEPWRAMYAAIQDGSLYLGGLSDAEKDSAMIRFFSLEVGENLIPFYEQQGIFANADVANELSVLPVADVPILNQLRCRPAMIHVTPQALVFSEPGTKTLYIGAPYNWSFAVDAPGPWLSIERKGDYPFATLEVTVNSLNLAESALEDSAAAANIFISSDPPTANSPVRIVVDYAPPGSISGTVTDAADGSAIKGVPVTAYAYDPGADGWSVAGSANTLKSGRYRIKDLAPGKYRLQFSSQSREYAVSYYDNAANLESAADVEVSSGKATVDIDAVLRRKGRISGTVTAAEGGSPLKGIAVQAHFYNAEEGYWTREYTVYTDKFGQYAFDDASPGEYLVFFDDRGGIYADEYYDGVFDRVDARAIDVKLAQDVRDIDADLVFSGGIAGTVRAENDGAPLSQIYVEVSRYDSLMNEWQWSAGVVTDDAGEYEVYGLSPGNYRVQFIGDRDTYASPYYDGVFDLSRVTEISVSAGQTTSHIDGVLPLAGQIAGIVTAELDGSPLADIRVEALSYNTFYSYWEWAAADATDSSGAYQIDGLNPISFIVRFIDPSAINAGEYYGGVLDLEKATLVAVASDQMTADIDATLAAASLPANDDISSPFLIEYLPYRRDQVASRATAQADDPFLPCSEGKRFKTLWYEFTPQVSGKVSISTWNSSYDTVLAVWEGKPDELKLKACGNDIFYGPYSSQARIEDIELEAGKRYLIEVASYFEDEAGILHFALTVEPGEITGLVTAESNGAPLQDITVEILQYVNVAGSWNAIRETVTEAQGKFASGPLYPGLYRLKFVDPTGSYLQEYYDDAATAADAADVLVYAEKTTANVNAALAAYKQSFKLFTPIVTGN